MNWLQIHCQVEKKDLELTEAIFYRYGAQGITLENATETELFEPLPGTSPLWDEIVVIGLFDASRFADSAGANKLDAENIQSHLSQVVAVQRTWVSSVENKAWERAWMDHYHPIKCAENLWIVPKWLESPNPEATNVLIDPGLAFGTGYHASTQMCLAWLASNDIKGKTVIDYGCGSGILGIAALKLGAKNVLSVDIDPQAITATKQNSELNGVSEKLWAGLPEEFEEHKSQTNFDTTEVLVANILAKPLMMLAPYFATLCHSGSSIVLAGLIQPQIDDIRASYQEWFTLPNRADLPENWISLSGNRL